MRTTLLLAVLAGAGALGSCTEIGGPAGDLAREADELADRKGTLSTELSKTRKLVKNADKLREEAAEHRDKAADYEKYAAELASAETFLDTRLAVWKPATRRSLEGLTLESFQTADGTLQGSGGIVKAVNDDHVVIEIGGSEKNFPYDSLSAEMKERFVHEPTVLQKLRDDVSEPGAK